MAHRFRTVLVVAALTFGLFVLQVPEADATACGGELPYVAFFGGDNGTGPMLILCNYDTYPALYNIPVPTGSPNCVGGGSGSIEGWNPRAFDNCLSSFRGHYSGYQGIYICIWDNSNYTGTWPNGKSAKLAVDTDTVNLAQYWPTANDRITSISWSGC